MRGSSPRKSVIVLAVATVAMLLAGCSGGGSGTSSGGPVTPGAPVGPATVEITLAAAPATGSAATPVTVAGSSTVPTPDPAYRWPSEIRETSPEIAHVFMEVFKVSLMPAEEAFESGDIDQDGSPSSPPDKPHFITIVPESPIRIDLLKLDNDKRFARFLNKFDSVPTGRYDKIRVYYRNVKVLLANGEELRFHPTANSKFDIHFRQGHELVIPATTDTAQPDGWVRFFRVEIDFVGLKLNLVPRGNDRRGWDACKVILRPQIFAEAGNEVLYSVAGTAENVDFTSPSLPVSGQFDVVFGTGPRIVPVAFDNDTTWGYGDNVLGRRPWSWFVGDVANTTAVTAFRDGAKVMAIGAFDPSLTLHASDIVFSFPAVRDGVADNVWLAPDNVAFVLHSAGDNITVFPQPSRSGAYYDNLVSPHNRLDDTYLDNNLLVRARGYFSGPDLHAYWISIGGVAP